ncbi:MAG: hypothetical protein IKJ95_07990 [Bacteroidaceae bacterium]|nr:hypothetical protein [Bacteroidaceae bacterium]
MANNFFTSEDFDKIEPPSKKKNYIIGGVVAVAAVVAALFMFGSSEESNTAKEIPDTVTKSYTALQKQTVHTDDKQNTENVQQIGITDISGVNTTKPQNAAIEKNISNEKQTATVVKPEKESVKKTEEQVKMNTLAPETVEKKALEVIRGNYGNNPVRRERLGSNYKVIQSRVNEMYREGQVW